MCDIETQYLPFSQNALMVIAPSALVMRIEGEDMKKQNITLANPLRFINAVFFVYIAAYVLEAVMIHTDKSFVSGLYIYKAVGLLAIAVGVRASGASFKEIGFLSKGAVACFVGGTIAGLVFLSFGYLAEYYVELYTGHEVAVAFSIPASPAFLGLPYWVVSAPVFLLLALLSAICEEGLFRGLFCELIATKSGFWKGAMYSALLYSTIQLLGPFREFLSDFTKAEHTAHVGLFLMASAWLIGIASSILCRMAKSIWPSIGLNFGLNAALSFVHIKIADFAIGAYILDELIVIRIAAAAIAAFLFIFIAAAFQSLIRMNAKKRPTIIKKSHVLLQQQETDEVETAVAEVTANFANHGIALDADTAQTLENGAEGQEAYEGSGSYADAAETLPNKSHGAI